MTTRTFRQKTHGRLGFLYTAFYRERLLRDVRAELAVVRMQLEQEKLDLSRAMIALDKADAAHDALTDKLAKRDAWIRSALAWMRKVTVVDNDNGELDSLLYMAPGVGEGEG